MPQLTATRSWQLLDKHSRDTGPVDIPALFRSDEQRRERFSLDGAGLSLDYSKQAVTPETVQLLLALARERGVPAAMARLMQGDMRNPGENRPVLHPALRGAPGTPPDVAREVESSLSDMEHIITEVRGGVWKGSSGEPIRDVVHIGIGGSELGPRLVVDALKTRAKGGPRAHFVANVDGACIQSLLASLNPETTLFVVVSKTFTTLETLTNARTARQWLMAGADKPAALHRHFVAVTAHPERATDFGIDPNNVLTFREGVGGRFSLWSPVGFVIAVVLGMDAFRGLLGGARAMDEHALNAPLNRNMPVLMGLLTIWNGSFRKAESQVVVPYAESLSLLPRYLQQLEMESGGKGATADGTFVDYPTAPILWGSVGTPAQHAYFQMLHQGPRAQPVDFIMPLQGDHDLPGHHRLLVANCLAQSAALMQGRDSGDIREECALDGLAGDELEAATAQRRFPGSRPSSTLLLPRLEPASLGALIALYEHKVFVQSVIWGTNAFDQWGVELGKQLAGNVLQAMERADEGNSLDPSTRALLARYLQASE